MSYNTWHVYGYGIRVDDIKTTPERLLNLAAIKPELLDDVKTYLSEMLGEYKVEDLTLEDFDEFDDDFHRNGVGVILYYVINEFAADYVEDFDGHTYVIFSETYPWLMSDKEKALTESDVREVFEKYIKILTDEPIEVDYQRIENGG